MFSALPRHARQCHTRPCIARPPTSAYTLHAHHAVLARTMCSTFNVTISKDMPTAAIVTRLVFRGLPVFATLTAGAGPGR